MNKEREIISRSTFDNAPNIDLSSVDFTKDDGFHLIVGVAGAVKATDWGGNTWTRTLPTGFYPIKLKKIFRSGTAATDLAACY